MAQFQGRSQNTLQMPIEWERVRVTPVELETVAPGTPFSTITMLTLNKRLHPAEERLTRRGTAYRWVHDVQAGKGTRRIADVVIIARGSRAGPREGVDVRLAKTLPFERVRVAREVLLDDYELRLGPVSAEAVGSVDGLIAARLHHGRRRYKRSGIVSIPKVRGATSSS